MANTIKIQIRRDTSANWESVNPVLSLAELGLDMTKNRLKAGDGSTAWNSLPWLPDDVYRGLEAALRMISGVTGGKLLAPVATVSALSTTYPSPTKGDMAYVEDQGAYYTWDGSAWTRLLSSTPTSTDVGSMIDDKLAAFGTFGMGYTVDSYNGASKPTQITFADGVKATLTWSGTRLDSISASTGEKVTMTYNSDGLITGRTVTKN